MSLHESILSKYIKSRRSQGKPNPFKDVKIIHHDIDDKQTIVIQLDTTEELDINAVEKLIAELIANDLVRNNLISIVTRRDGNSKELQYTGSIIVQVTHKSDNQN